MTIGPGLLLIDLDGNVRPAIHCGDELDELRGQVEIVQCPEPEPMKKAEAFAKLRQVVDHVCTESRKGKLPYRVVAIDSLTTLLDAAIRHAQKASGSLGGTVEMADWQVAFREAKSLLLQMKAAPVAFICIAHDMVVDVGGGETETRLAIPGKNLPNEIPQMFSDIWMMRTRAGLGGKQAFTILTKPKGQIKARCSGDLTPEVDAGTGLIPVFEKLGYDVAPQPETSS